MSFAAFLFLMYFSFACFSCLAVHSSALPLLISLSSCILFHALFLVRLAFWTILLTQGRLLLVLLASGIVSSTISFIQDTNCFHCSLGSRPASLLVNLLPLILLLTRS